MIRSKQIGPREFVIYLDNPRLKQEIEALEYGGKMRRSYPAYKDWVRKHNCQICGAHGPNEVHHLKGEFHQSGASLKAPDYLTMALCHTCHRYIHSGKGEWRAGQREALIRTLIRAFDEGMITINEIGWAQETTFGPLPTTPLERKRK